MIIIADNFFLTITRQTHRRPIVFHRKIAQLHNLHMFRDSHAIEFYGQDEQEPLLPLGMY